MSGIKGSKHGNSLKLFMEIVDSIELSENGCKLWPRGKDKDGYGYYSIKGKMYPSHRLLYQILKPGDYANLVVMHLCDNPLCCNIDHLKIGTASENTLDMVRKSRNVKGSLVGTSKLTEESAQQIRSEYPSKSVIKLAKEYGVCKQTICNVINKVTFINASYVDERYRPVHGPVTIIL